MQYIDLSVKKKKVYLNDAKSFIVCGNTDYAVRFSFDEEWDKYEEKVARIVYDEEENFVDIKLTNNECVLPPIYNTQFIYIGAYTEGLSSTDKGVINCVTSIIESEGSNNGNPNGSIGGGGGIAPTQYLKKAKVEKETNTLVITNQDNETIEYQGGGSGLIAFEIDENGELVLISENSISDSNFEIVDGNLVANL